MRLLVTLGLVMMMTGCGSESAPGGESAEPSAATPEAAPDGIDACSLLEPDEVRTVTGEAMQESLQEVGRGEGEHYLSICTFDPVSEASTHSISLSYRPSPEITDPAAMLERHVADTRENVMPEYALEPVDALGPGAGWDPQMGQLTVFRPGLMLMVSARSGDRDGAVRLARTALDRIP